MFRKKSVLLKSLLLTLLLIFAVSAPALANSKIEASKKFNNECFKCHSAQGLKSYNDQGKEISLYVDEKVFKDSIHGTNSCATCHQGITMYPHKNPKYGRDFVIEVNKRCQACHADVDQQYKNSIHGELLASGNEKTALCSDCHGVHNIFKGQDKRSMVLNQNQTEACGKCHKKVEESYVESFHGKANYLGTSKAARCTDCHTAHSIWGPKDARSTVSEANTPQTCAKCHVKPLANFAKGTEHYELKTNGPGTSKIMYYTVKFFSWLLFLVLSLFFLITLFDLIRKYRDANKPNLH